ncbi:class I adenylate-forming enzyme family protein [Vulcanisaeta souniana]|uniref:Fatty-acyl-CoA synthase n=1 Tax=Vulcanisaeta souniana JCM 11219 TaxID=1293586 RepID=A0A830E0P3_9CREN|nr:class I adenylate-forming enzyme family protein [Vulcanisaeta souniana]BDR91709.1 fatty-acyl-CoA synthase [Vulcanisaeta souniana JCM 11219]GGI71045.1 fatty-acyl-CoA synthase [Vulcanisaeta souniana JCM 11219]
MLESLLRHRARISDSVAIKVGDSSYTYSQLEILSNKMAYALSRLSIKANDRVITLVKSPLYHVALFFALRKIGAVLVPVNPRLGNDFLRFVINDINPSLIIDEYFNEGINIDKILEMAVDEYRYEYRMNLDEIAMILYTGGTTGPPKGAMIHEGSILWNAIITVLSWGLTRNDCTLVSLPLYHTGGWNVLLIPLLLVGGRTILPETDKFDPDWTIQILAREKCTIYMGVPTMLDAISKSPLFDKIDLSHVLFINGGGPLLPSVAKRFIDKNYRIFQGYGLTEAGPNNFYISPERYRDKPTSVGKPLLFIEMKLSGDGELLIRGPHVFKGYWNRPDENPFTSDNYLMTGDLFAVDDEGDFSFLDRKKDMIKTGGENVYSTEVEVALKQLPYIDDAAVFGVPDEHWGEAVVAVVVKKPGFKVTEDDVKRDLRKVLASYKVPKRIIFVKEIPKTQIGKISKRELREKYLKDGFKDIIDIS